MLAGGTKIGRGLFIRKGREPSFDPLGYFSGFLDTIEIDSSFLDQARRARCTVQVHGKTLPRFYSRARRRNPTGRSRISQRSGAHLSGGKTGSDSHSVPLVIQERRSATRAPGAPAKAIQRVSTGGGASWNRPELLDWFEESGVGFCNIDQPLFRHSIKPSLLAASKIGYIRLHGRNYRTWFTENRQPPDRYDYLYPLDELEPWVERVRMVSKQARETFVVTNNHYLVKAVVNALDM